MDSYRFGRSLALTCGVLIGLVIALILVRYMNRNHKLRTDYDEMQKKVRNQGYMYAFYTVIIFEGLMSLITSFVDIPAEPIVIHFTPIFLGVLVQACYCIWKGAYVGLNTNLKRYIIVAAVATIINLLAFVMACKNGDLVVNGVLQATFINFLCAVMFAVLGVTALLRKAIDREVEE